MEKAIETRMMLKIKFRERLRTPGDDQDIDICGFRLYGRFPENVEVMASICTVSEHTFEDEPETDCQCLAFWFHFRSLVSYSQIMRLMDEIVSRLGVKGYVKVRATVENLVSTTQQLKNGHLNGAPGGCHALGYNAASGFTVVVEKPGTTPDFTSDEIAQLKQAAVELSYAVYGRPFKVVC